MSSKPLHLKSKFFYDAMKKLATQIKDGTGMSKFSVKGITLGTAGA